MKGLDLSILAGFLAIFIAPDGTGRWFGWALVQIDTRPDRHLPALGRPALKGIRTWFCRLGRRIADEVIFIAVVGVLFVLGFFWDRDTGDGE